MHKTYKKLFFAAVGCTAGLAGTLALLMYFADPCNLYSLRNEYQVCADRFANPGRIRHHLYKNGNFDSLVVGSSISQNFLGQDVRRYLGWDKPMRLFIPGYYIGELDALMRYALESGKIKKVLRGIDADHYETDDDSRVWRDSSTFPLYLYGGGRLNGIKYLLSHSTFAKAVELLGKKRIRRKNFPKADDNDTFGFWAADAVNTRNAFFHNRDFDPSGGFAVKNWRPRKRSFAMADKYIVRLAKDYPETDFYLFFPPYAYGMMPAEYLDMKTYLVEKTAGMKNVFFFDFADMADVSSNSAYYRDKGHYNANINTAMLKAVGRGEYRVTAENLEKHTADLVKLFSSAWNKTDFEATMVSPPVYQAGPETMQAGEDGAVFSTGKRAYEFGRTYVLAVEADVPADGTLFLSWQPAKKQGIPVAVSLKKGRNKLYFPMTFIPAEQEVSLKFQAGPGTYAIKDVRISRQRDDFKKAGEKD